MVFTLLVSFRSAFTFSIKNTDSSKSANISHAIHIIKVTRRSPSHVHDMVVAYESAIYNLHHEGSSYLIVKSLHLEFTQIFIFTFMIEAATFK